MTTEKRSFQNALKWAYLGNWGDKLFTALFTFILAGILGPREFGIVSLGIIYVSFLQMFLEQGLATALIQRKELKPEHLNAVFWTNLGCSLALVVVSLALARLWAEANHAPDVALITPLLSVSLVLESLSIVQVSLLNREMNFRSLTIRSNISVLLSGIVGIAMAFGGCGIWSLVAQQLLRDLISVVLLWKMSRWRPSFSFSWPHLKDLLEFSLPNFVAKLGIFVDGQTTSIALGLLFGPKAVGLFRVADRVSASVITMAMAAAHSVSLPEFSRYQSDPAKLREAATTCIRLAGTVTVPALAGLAMVSSPLLAMVGQEWLVAGDVLKITCVSGIVMVFTFFTGPLLQALGRTRALAVLEWGRTAANFVVLVLVAHFVHDLTEYWQILGIPLARLVAGLCLVVPIFLYIFLKLSGLHLRGFLGAIFPSVASAISVVIAVALFQRSGFLSDAKPLFLLAAEVVVGAAVGIPVLLQLDHHLRRSAVSLLQRVLTFRKRA